MAYEAGTVRPRSHMTQVQIARARNPKQQFLNRHLTAVRTKNGGGSNFSIMSIQYSSIAPTRASALCLRTASLPIKTAPCRSTNACTELLE